MVLHVTHKGRIPWTFFILKDDNFSHWFTLFEMAAEETEQKNRPDKFCSGGHMELISFIGGFRNVSEDLEGLPCEIRKIWVV